MYHHRHPFVQQQQVDYYRILDDFYVPTNAAYVAQKVDLALRFLVQFNESAMIMSNARAYNALVYLASLDIDYYEAQLINYNSMGMIFANVCYHYYQDLHTKSSAARSFDSYEFDVFCVVLSLIYTMSDRCKPFADAFLQHRGVASLINYLSEDSLVKKLVEFKRKEKGDTRKSGLDAISYMLGILVNVRTLGENAKADYNVINVLNVITRLLKHVKSHEVQRILAVMLIVNLANDDEIGKVPIMKTVAEDITKIIKIAAKAISENYNLTRRRACIESEEEIELVDEICFVSYNSWNWNIAKLLTTLSRLATSDQMKSDIYETFNMKEYLEKIVFYGNETEKMYATKLVWQLCFNGSIAKKVVKSENLFQPIANIAKQVNFKNTSLKKYCDGILWSLQPNVTQAIKGADNSKNHIMISYNSKSRDVCTRIKDQLEANGHTVWIDFERISGSSLDSMASAVENCKLLLMCMTEKYKESPNCRAEAEYAFRLNKQIIPLILEKDYQAEGWLGLVAGSRIYVNFTKNAFDECMRQLLNQISMLVDGGNKPAVVNKTRPPLQKGFTVDQAPKEKSPPELRRQSDDVITRNHIPLARQQVPDIQITGDGNPERIATAATLAYPPEYTSLPVVATYSNSKNPSPRLHAKVQHVAAVNNMIDQLASKLTNLSTNAFEKLTQQPQQSRPSPGGQIGGSDFSKLLDKDLTF